MRKTNNNNKLPVDSSPAASGSLTDPCRLREKEALRANLARRKAQIRGKTDADGGEA